MSMGLHLFMGEQWLRQRAISQLKRRLREQSATPWLEIQLDGEEFSLEKFVEALQTSPLFRENVMLHIRRVEKLRDPEAVAQYLERPLPPDHWIILEAEKLDKREKLYQTIARLGRVQDYPHPDRRSLPSLTNELLHERGIKLSPQGLRHLLESVEGTLSRLGSEIEKLTLYSGGGELSPADLEGLLFHDRGGDVFKCLDALIERRSEALLLLGRLLERGEEPTKVFFLLASQARGLLMIRSLAEEGASNEDIARRTGDFSWLVAKRRRISEHLSTEELIQLIHRLHEEDLRIKRGERQPEETLWVLALEWLFSDSSLTRSVEL